MCRSNERRAHRDRGPRRREAGLVARVADGTLRPPLLERRDHAEVQRLRRARVRRRRVRDEQRLGAERADRSLDLAHRRHARRQDERPARALHRAEERHVGERRRRGLVARRVEALHEVDGGLVPARREPRDLPLAAAAIDLLVLALAELHAPAVLDVRHATPRRVALEQPLIARDAELRGPLLELHGVATCEHGAVDELLRDVDRAVVVDPDLRDDEDRLSVADASMTDADRRTRHGVTPSAPLMGRARVDEVRRRWAPN